MTAIDVLRELVALKDMKDRNAPNGQGYWFSEDDRQSYRERQPKAWAAARAALSARPEEGARERLLNQIIALCERLDDCSAAYIAERIRDDFLIGRHDMNEERNP